MSLSSTAPDRAAIWTLSDPGTSQPVESTVLPDDGSRRDESIFYPDNRIPVNRADFQDGGKYRSIVKIQSRFEDKQRGESIWKMGTGWLICDDIIVTGGDVVYDRRFKLGECTQMKCYIGYNGRDSVNSPQVQSRHGVNVATTADWVQTNQNRMRDVAFIKVNRPFEGDLGKFKFEATPLSGDGINLGVVGYPGDKTFNNERGGQMYAEFAKTSYDLKMSPYNLIEYQVSTFGGQNGAPILRKDGGQIVSIGTHCYGDSEHCNSGTSIDNKYGNNYDGYVGLFNDPSTFGSQVNFVKVPPQ
ncbi:hypothetical protein BHE90_000014 [Fusarium euwallaceae]|uniref:Serine protease n=1 Tax=Fusarium euwallaceae TaxID=1147111 RepID=A0A430MBB6_9HYPO|nr:hypothetical protein BHE90_000014 [Fusarium euwallaceae]